MALRGVERDVEPPFANPHPRDELGQRVGNPEARILEVHRIDRMRRDRHLDARAADLALLTEAEHAGDAAARALADDAVEIDEADRLARPVGTRDAGAQAAGHECQVRVGVLRFDGALLVAEVLAPLQLVVLVAGAFGKHRAERLDVGRHALKVQPRRDAAIEEAGRGVGRPVEALRIGGERLVLGGKSRPHLDHLEASLGCHFQDEIQRSRTHGLRQSSTASAVRAEPRGGPPGRRAESGRAACELGA